MTTRMRYCFNCGDELGLMPARDYDRLDTCGKRQCEREARDTRQQQREEAHDRLDGELGFGGY